MVPHDDSCRTRVGARTFAHGGLVSLDVAGVAIGRDTVVGAGAVVEAVPR